MSQKEHECNDVKKAFRLVQKRTRSSTNLEAKSGDQSTHSDSPETKSLTTRKRRRAQGSGSGDASDGRVNRGRSKQKRPRLQPRSKVGVADSDSDASSATHHSNERSEGSGHVRPNGTTIYRHQLTALNYVLNFLKSVGIRHTSQESLEGLELDPSEVVTDKATWSKELRHKEIWLYAPKGVTREYCSIFAVHGLDHNPSENDEREILETAARAPRKENKENSLTVVVYYNKEGEATKVSAGFLGHQLPNDVNRPVEEVRGLQPEFVGAFIDKLASNDGPWIIS